MAIDGFAPSYAPPRTDASVLAAIGYVGLLLLIFVGLTPFSPPLHAATAGAAESAHGDKIRQILYLSIFAPIVLAAVLQQGVGALRAVPVLLGLLLGWCLLSCLWSSVPDITLRRAILATLVSLSVLLSVETIGAERAFRLWRILLAIILVVNWVSIPLIETARHLPGETDVSLIGDWRGLYGQKNTTGAVCVLTILLFLFSHNGKRNWIGILVALAAFGFLVMTRSKTSLALLPVALLAGWTYRISWRDGLGRAIFACCAALLLAGIALALVFGSDAIAHRLEDPAQFTGRAEIWQASFAFLRDHFLLGAGFGTVANTGSLSPLHNYVHNNWVETISDSHNGYLQLFVALGAVGLGLALLALVLAPLAGFWPLDRERGPLRALLFAVFVFLLLHNFMESEFLESDSGPWIAFLIMLASLRNTNRSLTSSL